MVNFFGQGLFRYLSRVHTLFVHACLDDDTSKLGLCCLHLVHSFVLHRYPYTVFIDIILESLCYLMF